MKRIPVKSFVLLFAAVFSASCASAPAVRDAERLALYRNHAGEPVKGFQYYGRFSNWTPLGDSAIAIWVGPSRVWLLDMYGPCSDLDFADTISLSSNNGRVSARFDTVRVHNRGALTIPCRIKEIRPVDGKALRAEEKSLRARREAGETPQASGT
ncbi:MAG: hypothetical protein KA144_08350 [Xanthomonadaceae bacterium]|nr:hypothetical protein [Xanthomonadaceae bacterium]